MEIEIITKEDLQTFRQLLLKELNGLVKAAEQSQYKEWLKSGEVRKLLKISAGTLQNLRVNGSLAYTKIGGLIFYNYQDIEKLLEQNRVDNSMSSPPDEIDKRQMAFPFPENKRTRI
jgi:Helix-turn-helix domain